MIKYLVVFEKTATGFSVYVPDLPGCVATGETKDIAEKNIYKAIIFHLEGLREESQEIPQTSSEAGMLYIEV